MTLPSVRLRALALLFGLIGLAALGTPAHALDPYPGETREAFVARSALEQQRKLAEADAAASALAPGLAGGGSSDSGLGGGLQLGGFGLAMLALGGWRMSRGIFRASRTLTKTPGGQIRGVDTFEDRLAERLRELDRVAPTVPQPVSGGEIPAVTAASVAPASRPTSPGVRTFGRRAS